jgi:proteasome lid subunit RPN8/RPN11
VSNPGDDIVFDEMRFREPRRTRRPDQDPRFATIACGTPAPGELPIFLERTTAELIERHALSDTSVELGGILLGIECTDDRTGEPFVWISQAVEAKHFENTQASFTYTHDSWQEITRERDLRFPELDIVGWYHTHPDFGIFLSSHDLFIHEHFFSQTLQVAYVVDPIRQERGFFFWKDGDVRPVAGFHVVARRSDRLLLARLVNDFENVPSPGESSLSPRLEAELMAALQRQPVIAGPAPTSNAAVTGIAGMILGAVLLASYLWLANLSRVVEDQSSAMRALAESQARAGEAATERARLAAVEAKERALDALLRDVAVGEPPERFVARYTTVVKERDELKDRMARLALEKDALTEHGTREKTRADTLASEIQALKQSGGETGLRAALDKAKSENETLTAQLAEQDQLVGEGGVPGLQQRYRYTLWAAIGGWAIAIAGALASVLWWLRQRAAAEAPAPLTRID